MIKQFDNNVTIRFNIRAENKLEIEEIYCNTLVDEFTIPETIIEGNITYTIVGFYTYSSCRNAKIKKIIIPNSICFFSSCLFKFNKYLEDINIPDSITSIPEYCFVDCKKLKKVNIGENTKLRYIGESSFWGCKNLEHFEFPNTLNQIANYAFMYSGIKSVMLPKNVKIGHRVFTYCKNIKSIVFIGDVYKSVSPIRVNTRIFPFDKNNNVEYSLDIKYLIDNYGINIAEKTLKYVGTSMSKLLSFTEESNGIVVSPKLNHLGENTYSGHIYIPKKIVIEGGKVKSIIKVDDFAFSFCPNLKSITIEKGIDFNEKTICIGSSCIIIRGN